MTVDGTVGERVPDPTDAAFVDVLTEILRQGRQVRFHATGMSMIPAIREGEAITVVAAPPTKIRRRDVILYRSKRGVIAHRVVRVRRDGEGCVFITRGDASVTSDEPVDASAVLGRVVAVERGGRTVHLTGRQTRLVGAVLGRAVYLARRLRARLAGAKQSTGNAGHPTRQALRDAGPGHGSGAPMNTYSRKPARRRVAKWRLSFSRFLFRLAHFVESLPSVVMRPDELIEYGRRHYERASTLDVWSRDVVVDMGFDPEEKAALSAVSRRDGRALVLGLGGGREAIALARLGFAVTGVDFVQEMVTRALENAVRRGFPITGLVQDMRDLDVSPDAFCLVWLSTGMYSSIPTRRRRIELLRRGYRVLEPGGFFVCQFSWDARYSPNRLGVALRRTVATLILGNRSYEPGDVVSGGVEFFHTFWSESELRAEFDEAGLELVKLSLPETRWGCAVLRKPAGGSQAVRAAVPAP
jgi:signal peptidase I